MPIFRETKTLKICVVSKGDNIEALTRTFTSLQTIIRQAPSWVFDFERQQYQHPTTHTNMILYLLVDEAPNLVRVRDMVQTFILHNCYVHLVVTPKQFVTQHARFKARALEYFRQQHVLDTDWVLHMDEESTIDSPNLLECINFIHDGQYDIGQGIILYNAHNYNQWSITSQIITVADALRTTDDCGRFRFQYYGFHRPWFGLHGSFLMIRGSLENKVTWNFGNAGNLAEDYAFGMQCTELKEPVRCGPIMGIVREVSPQTIGDFMKQRRRWFVGICTLPYLWPRFMCLLWTLGSLTCIATYLHIGLAIAFGHSLPPTPIWLSGISLFPLSTYVYLYALGLWIQHMDKMTQLEKGWLYSIGYTIGHLLLAILFLVPVSLLECSCIYYSLWRLLKHKQLSFQVIRK
jgi:hypothetical protein